MKIRYTITYLWCSTGFHLWTTFVPHNVLFRSSSKLTPIMFAGDTNLFISDSNIENIFETIKEKLGKVATWFKGNKLSLNISKTKHFLLHSSRKRKDISNIFPPLHIGNVLI